MDAPEIGVLPESTSLRDWFAGQALTCVMDLLPSEASLKSGVDSVALAEAVAKVAARWAYAIADAMIAERSK